MPGKAHEHTYGEVRPDALYVGGDISVYHQTIGYPD